VIFVGVHPRVCRQLNVSSSCVVPVCTSFYANGEHIWAPRLPQTYLSPWIVCSRGTVVTVDTRTQTQPLPRADRNTHHSFICMGLLQLSCYRTPSCRPTHITVIGAHTDRCNKPRVMILLFCSRNPSNQLLVLLIGGFSRSQASCLFGELQQGNRHVQQDQLPPLYLCTWL